MILSNFSFRAKKTSFGTGVQSLVGVEENRVVAWHVYRNNQRIFDIATLRVKDGDMFIVKYEKR